jgi:hypothetical protein
MKMIAITTMMVVVVVAVEATTNKAAEAVEAAWQLGPKLHRMAIGYT